MSIYANNREFNIFGTIVYVKNTIVQRDLFAGY